MRWITDRRLRVWLIDPILWFVLIAALLYFQLSLAWLLIIIPIWVALRVWWLVRNFTNNI